MYCPKCQKIIAGKIRICPTCHSVLANVITDPTNINRLTPTHEKENKLFFWITLILPWVGFFLYFSLRDRHSVNTKYIIKGFRAYLLIMIIFIIIYIKRSLG